jgi:hypothetical protein
MSIVKMGPSKSSLSKFAIPVHADLARFAKKVIRSRTTQPPKIGP